MNITLRKANQIQNSINEILNSIEFTTTVDINEFQNFSEVISNAENEFAINLARRDNLLSALYELRKLVAKGNNVAEINDKLADVALLEKQIQFFSNLAAKKPRETDEVIDGKLNKIRNQSDERSYFNKDSVTTSIFDKEEIAGFRAIVAQHKKQKQIIQDQVLEMNVRTELPLSEATVKTLQAEGII